MVHGLETIVRLNEEATKSSCPVVLPLDDEVRFILGRPNFWCASVANALRRAGQEIQTRSEDEQACVIHWMLSLYALHGDKWRDVAHQFVLDANKLGTEPNER